MSEEAVPSATRWRAVVLVCKACGKRGKAPKQAKPKMLAADVRRLTKGCLPQRPRVVMTGCLGLCPKGATAVAVAGRDVATRIVAIAARAQLSVVPAMLAPTPTPTPTPPDASPPVRAPVVDVVGRT